MDSGCFFPQMKKSKNLFLDIFPLLAGNYFLLDKHERDPKAGHLFAPPEFAH